MELKGWSFDIEADNLYLQSTKIWYIRFKSLDGTRQMKILFFNNSKEGNYNQVMEWINSFDDGAHVVTHNGLGYDTWMLWRFFGIQPRVGKQSKDWLGDKHVQFVDGYVLSQYLNPNAPRHSLAALSGSESDDGKIDYRKKLIEDGAMTGEEPKGHEFTFYHPLVETYCDRDVDATIRVVKDLWKQAQQMYGESWLHPSFRQMQKDYFLYSAQAFTGVKFNKEKALILVEHIEEEMKLLKDYVDPLLPPRPLKTAELAYYKQPAKPFSKSGEISASMVKFLEKHNATLDGRIITAYGETVQVESNAVLPVELPMEIDDNAELKQYFLDSGWTPSEDYWNVQKGADGKPIRDANGKFIKTTPKINNAGKLCPNLLKLDGDVPKKVVKFLSYRNRLGVITGWLNNWRLDFDGRLSAEISGYAPTSRVKHRSVVNVPKAADDILLGHQMRELFCVDKGNWYIGTDASALENRTLAGYTYKYDDGAFARVQLEGDPHCYAEDTQVLTLNGWSTFGNLTKGEKVAQWDAGEISFVEPSHVVWQDYEGEMVSVSGMAVDFLVTPNHRVLIRDYRSGSEKVKLAHSLHNRNSNWRLPTHGFTTSEGLALKSDEIRFIVALQADGSMSKTALRFEFVKERKINRMREILNRLSIPFTESNGKGEVTTRFYVKKIHSDFVFDGVNTDKTFSNNLLKMSSSQCEVFVEEIRHWDGTTLDSGDTILDTTCEVSCNMVATISSLVGRKTRRSVYDKRGGFGDCIIHRCYISKDCDSIGVALLGSNIKTVTYKGKIGCVSVPSTFVLVKRNGKILVSGNTFNAFAFFPHLSSKFDVNNPETKELPDFKPWRNKAKTGAYLLAFGGGAPKLASSLGLSKSDGKIAFDNYWEKNKGLGLLKKALESYYDTTGQKKYIPAIDGRIVSVRGKNVLLSCLGQGCGAIAMSYAGCLMDNWLGDMQIDNLGRPYYEVDGFKVKRVSFFHDEYSWEVEDGAQDYVKGLSVKGIVKAGEVLKLALPLAAEGKMAFEGSWQAVH